MTIPIANPTRSGLDEEMFERFMDAKWRKSLKIERSNPFAPRQSRHLCNLQHRSKWALSRHSLQNSRMAAVSHDSLMQTENG